MKLKQQVNPKMAAAAIVLVLAVVQVAWWRGLVTKPKPGGSQKPGGGASRGGARDLLLTGREDVTVETIAGDPEPGFADGIGRDARFDGPSGLALDAGGNIIVADTRNHKIRLVAPDGRTSTIAGSLAGYADGESAHAQFNEPSGVAVGPDGTIYVADTANHRIRAIKNGRVTTLAGGEPGIADGTGAAAKFQLPVAISVRSGNPPTLVVADAGDPRLRYVTLSGAVTSGPTLVAAPVSLAAGGTAAASPGASAIYTGTSPVTHVPVDRDGHAGSAQADGFRIDAPCALAAAPDGGLYAVDGVYAAVFLIRKGVGLMLAGSATPGRAILGFRDGTGNKASFSMPAGVASDGKGLLYVADTGNNAIRRLKIGPELLSLVPAIGQSPRAAANAGPSQAQDGMSLDDFAP